MQTAPTTSPDVLKALVREKYGEIAQGKVQDCCSTSCGVAPEGVDIANFADDYTQLAGYEAEADLGLGCGLPTQLAKIKPGDTVVDLGSGAGNDCFVAAAENAPDGMVFGIDFTPEMLALARENANKRGLGHRLRFLEGDIEQLPLPNASADVVVSNCVMNLVPDKLQAFRETFRILKPGGHFSISDIVLKGELPDSLRNEAMLYVGCVSGAIQLEAYLDVIRSAGFQDIEVQRQRKTPLPIQLLQDHLNAEQVAEFETGTRGVYAITVFGRKPQARDLAAACTPGGGCC
jgi:SAM-dependent methyltransferase